MSLKIEFSHHLSKVSMENFELLDKIFCIYYVQGGQPKWNTFSDLKENDL